MKYYKAVFKDIPTVTLAHKYETDNYIMKKSVANDNIEISFLETGDVYGKYDSREEIYKTPCIRTWIHNENVVSYSNEFHRHFTFAIRGNITAEEISEDEIVRLWQSRLYETASDINITAVFPEYIAEKNMTEIVERLIKRIIYEKSAKTYSGELYCHSAITELLGQMTDWCVKKAVANTKTYISPKDMKYCTKITNYISEHINEKITVADISEEVSLSAGHISRVFKSVMGCTMTEFINREKTEFAKTLFAANEITAAEAARLTGIYDEKYFCKLFKKYTGMTVSEYREAIKIEYKK